MYDIKHLIQIDCHPNKVYKAITEKEGIQGWWTREVKIKPESGSYAEFTFGGLYYNKMIIEKLLPNKRVEWECLEGDKEWIGTSVIFDLEEKDGNTILRFSHGNWISDTDFYATCNYHWGHYMKSIKDYCETGTGNPYENLSL